jgi:long-chain acyl-CoA synthetase
MCRVLHVFPVDERAPRTTLAMAGRVLARGKALVWFPESWRSPDGRLQRFLPGVGRLLLEHPVPVVPTFICGTFEAMPRDRSWPRPHPVTVSFGPPADREALREAGEGETAEARITDGLRRRIARLSEAAAYGKAGAR